MKWFQASLEFIGRYFGGNYDGAGVNGKNNYRCFSQKRQKKNSTVFSKTAEQKLTIWIFVIELWAYVNHLWIFKINMNYWKYLFFTFTCHIGHHRPLTSNNECSLGRGKGGQITSWLAKRAMYNIAGEGQTKGKK